jgi:glycerol-3-phosphate dehydrogenase
MYMSELVPKALGRKQPMAFFSGPSFAKELMMQVPTAVTVAAESAELRGNEIHSD